MSNPQGELFKELSSNELFKKYLDQEYDENTILNNALNDDELMTKLKNILDDNEIIKSKMQIKISQVKKSKNKVNQPKNTNESNNKLVNESNNKLVNELNNEDIVFIPYTENGITYLTPTIKMERVGFNMKLTTPDFEVIY
jgi:hypothetical protein